jgi:hypothetical protein
MKILRSSLLLAVVLPLSLTACRTGQDWPLHAKTNTLTVAHVPGSALAVELNNGSITARAEDRQDVEVIGVLRMRSQERLEAASIETFRDASDRLTVKVAWPENRRLNNEGCSITLAVPDADGLDFHSSNGRIEISGLSGEARLRTSNGQVVVDEHHGALHAHTSNGQIKIQGTAGVIDAETSNGRIAVVDAQHSVTARTSNGSMEISFTEAATGPVEARSSNGSISLTVGSGFQGALQANTSNGRLDPGNFPEATTVSSGKHHVNLQFGDSETKSKVRTSNGSITLRER